MAVLQAATIDLETFLPVTLTAPGLSEEGFLALCQKFPDAMLEYSCDGTVIIMPSTDPETGKRVNLVNYRLMKWAESGSGSVTGPDAGFLLPNGSRRSPDAAWFSEARWQRTLSKGGTRFPVFTPEFVIELRSPGDRLGPQREKMQEYIRNGAELGWLIDPAQRTVTIYRPGREPETLTNPESVRGEGPVDGFVLSLVGIL
jgi:Uma2 family endonuclease